MSNLNTGLAITVIGMGLVFAVLILLAVVIALVMRLGNRVSGTGQMAARAQEPVHAADSALTIQRLAPGMAPGDQPTPDELAAIVVAVRLHQIVRRKQAAPAMRTHQPGSLPSRWVAIGRARQSQTWQRR